MGISNKLRFEVFKRDKFACQYCGRTPPKVILEVDHIHPVSEGGSDDIQNLLTSCSDCNHGKGNTPLGFTKTRHDLDEDKQILAERENQLKEYQKFLKRVRQREDRDIDKIEQLISELSGDEGVQDIKLNKHGRESFRRFLKIFPVDIILEAINISQHNLRIKDPERIIRYTYGILHNWHRDGRATVGFRGHTKATG